MGMNEAFLNDIKGLGLLYNNLSEGSKNLKVILDTIPSAIALVDVSGKFIYINKHGYELYGIDYTGFSMDAYISRVKALRLDGSSFLLEDMPISQSLKTGQIVRNIEMIIENATGIKHPVTVSSVPLHDNHGEMNGAVFIFEDFTERKQVQEKVRRQNVTLQAINKIYEKYVQNDSLEQLVTNCLETIEDITESSISLIGEIGSDCFFRDIAVSTTEWENCEMHNKSGKRKPLGNFHVRRLCSSVLENGQPLLTNDPSAHLESNGVPPGHEEIKSFLSVPHLSDGKVIGIIAVANREGGYTEDEKGFLEALTPTVFELLLRKRTEEALWESKAQLKLDLEDTKILQSISTELLNEDNTNDLYEKIIDAAARIMHSDFASLQIFYPEHGCGQLKLLVHRGFNPQAAKFWEWVDASNSTSCGVSLRTGQRTIIPNVNECDFIKDTEDLEIFLQTGVHAVQTTPLISRGGKLLGMISTHWRYPHHPPERELLILDVLARQAADLIERKQAEEALRNSEKLALELVEKLRQEDQNKNAFINMLSHELRNPMASIMMGLDLLDKVPGDGKHAAMALEIAKRQGQQLTRLVDDLLDVTRITQNKIALKIEKVELNEIINKAILDYQSHFVDKIVRIEVKLTLPLYLEADSFRLTQVIGNLLHNAAKFTSNNDLVTVTVSQDADTSEAVITVQDTGRGIDPKYLGNLFEPFTQVDTSLDRRHGGLGLGLAIVKGIVELHGGRIDAFSEGRDKGARFTIRLPLPKEDIGEQERDERHEPGSNELLTILMIDDNKDLAGVMCEFIDFIGHKTTAAYNGAEGIAAAREIRPEVIICDIGLPGMSGYEVAQLIRKDPELQNTFLIALSGYAQSKDIERSKEAGFDRHLGKPVSIDILQQVLNDANRERI